MADTIQPSFRNHLLTSLSAEDFGYIAPHLQPVEFTFRTTLHSAGEPIVAVFFPEQGYASMLAALEDGDAAEVGMIGNEGIIGVPAILGTDRSPTEAMIQAAGHGMRLPVDLFRRALNDRPDFRTLMLRFAMAFTTQVTMTAACNCRHLVEQRLARWLLMAHDRTDGNEFAMTHEFLSTMLGVRRAGITVAAGALQRAGYISYDQGRIRVVDRSGLESAACDCHASARREFARLLGPMARQ